MHCLDTSAAIEILRGSEKGREIKELLSDDAFITAFSVHELFVGTHSSQSKTLEEFLKNFEVLDYNSECASKSAAIERSLSRQGKKINVIDVLIAGICMNASRTLISTDNDFRKINGLDVKIID